MIILSYLKKYSFLILLVTVFLVTFLVVAKPFAQGKSQYLNQEYQMNYQEGLQSSAQIFPKLSSNKNQMIHLLADEFYFETHLDFPPSVITH